MIVSDRAPTRSLSVPLQLNVEERDESHIVLTHGNVLIAIWSGSQEPQACERIYDSLRRIARSSGTGKVSALSIIQPGTTAPSARAREALGRLLEDRDGVIFRSALVYPNVGFLASIVRSVALSLMQRSAKRNGHQVFQRVHEALAWVTDGLPTASGQPIATLPLLRALDSHLANARSRVA